MRWINSIIGVTLACSSLSDAAARPVVIAAAGRWAALRAPAHCEAASLALYPANRTRAQGRASLSFDRRRRGEFSARLSRAPRAGSSVMLTIGETPFLLAARGSLAWSRGAPQEEAIITALRGGGAMRIEARAANGARFVDRYALAGAPTATDAAAACASTMPRER